MTCALCPRITLSSLAHLSAVAALLRPTVAEAVVRRVRQRLVQDLCKVWPPFGSILQGLLFLMGKCTEGAPRAIARVLDVVTLCRLVNLGVELLLSPGVAVLAIVSCITVRRVAPLVGSLHRGTGGAAVLVLPWTPPPVLVVVELGTSIALPTQPGRLLARLRLVVGEHVGRVQPLGVVVQQASLLVQAVWTKPILITRLVHFPCFPAIVHGRSEVVCPMGESAMGSVLDTVAAVVCVVDAHPGLVIPQVVPSLRVPGCSVEQWTFISVRAESCCLVILLAVYVCAVVECLVPPPHWPSSFLILKVPVEASEGPVLLA